MGPAADVTTRGSAADHVQREKAAPGESAWGGTAPEQQSGSIGGRAGAILPGLAPRHRRERGERRGVLLRRKDIFLLMMTMKVSVGYTSRERILPL